MTTYTLHPTALRAIATLTHVVGVKDEVDVLQSIKLEATEQEWRAVATNRHVVVEMSGGMGDYVHTLNGETSTVLVKATDLTDYTKRIGARSAIPIMVTIDHERQEIELNNEDVRGIYKTVQGNYPPVEHLFPTDQNSEISAISLRPDALAAIGKVLPPEHVNDTAATKRTLPLTLTFGKRNEYGKDEPITITRPGIDNWRALLQPIMKR